MRPPLLRPTPCPRALRACVGPSCCNVPSRRQVVSDAPQLLGFRPEALYRAGVEQFLTGRSIPPKCPAPVLVLERPYGLQGFRVSLGESAGALQVLYVAVGADVRIMRVGGVSSAVAVAIPLAGVLLLCEAQPLRLARHNAGVPNDVHIAPLNG